MFFNATIATISKVLVQESAEHMLSHLKRHSVIAVASVFGENIAIIAPRDALWTVVFRTMCFTILEVMPI